MTIAAQENPTNPKPSIGPREPKTAADELAKLFPGIVANIKTDEEIAEIEAKRTAKPLTLDSSFPARHRALKSVDILGPEWKAKLEMLRKRLYGPGALIALLGGYGRGKTQMATELGREVARIGKTTKFADAMEIFVRSKSSFSPAAKETEWGIMQEFTKPYFLVIDETEERAETPFEDKKLFTMINRRYNANRHTVLISNQTPSEFQRQVGPKIWERMTETGGIVNCEWGSFRN